MNFLVYLELWDWFGVSYIHGERLIVRTDPFLGRAILRRYTRYYHFFSEIKLAACSVTPKSMRNNLEVAAELYQPRDETKRGRSSTLAFCYHNFSALSSCRVIYNELLHNPIDSTTHRTSVSHH